MKLSVMATLILTINIFLINAGGVLSRDLPPCMFTIPDRETLSKRVIKQDIRSIEAFLALDDLGLIDEFAGREIEARNYEDEIDYNCAETWHITTHDWPDEEERQARYTELVSFYNDTIRSHLTKLFMLDEQRMAWVNIVNP